MKPEEKEILKQRAKEIAIEPEEKDREEYLEFLEFVIAEKNYAIESSFVVEAYPIRDLTEIPFTPDFIVGVINVRGQIFSVLDLKILFNLPAQPLTPKSKAIIVRNEAMEFALFTDIILGVNQIRKSSIQETPITLTGLQAEYISGITKDGLIILDIDKMLSDKRMIVHQEV